MPDYKIDFKKVYGRIKMYRRAGETVAKFRDRCGITQPDDSRWDDGKGISLEKLAYMVAANPEMSLDYIVMDRVTDEGPYHLIERLVDDVAQAMEPTLRSLPSGRRLRIVRDEGPPPEPPDADPSAPD